MPTPTILDCLRPFKSRGSKVKKAGHTNFRPPSQSKTSSANLLNEETSGANPRNRRNALVGKDTEVLQNFAQTFQRFTDTLNPNHIQFTLDDGKDGLTWVFRQCNEYMVVYQMKQSIEIAKVFAKNTKREIDKQAKEVAATLKGFVLEAPIKSFDSILEKLTGRESSSETGGNVADLLDVARNTIVLRTEEDLKTAYDSLLIKADKMYGKIDETTRLRLEKNKRTYRDKKKKEEEKKKNNEEEKTEEKTEEEGKAIFAKKKLPETYNGYSDYTVFFPVPYDNAGIAVQYGEVQLNIPQVLWAKQGADLKKANEAFYEDLNNLMVAGMKEVLKTDKMKQDMDELCRGDRAEVKKLMTEFVKGGQAKKYYPVFRRLTKGTEEYTKLTSRSILYFKAARLVDLKKLEWPNKEENLSVPGTI